MPGDLQFYSIDTEHNIHIISLILQQFKVPNLQYPLNVTRVIKSRFRWAGHVEYFGEMQTKIARKPKNPFWVLTRRWENTTEPDLKQIWCKDMNWNHALQTQSSGKPKFVK
jgi:hypothetical protein